MTHKTLEQMSQEAAVEQMTRREELECQFWEMYKDAYGVRPRGIDTSTWTLADFEMEFASLGAVIQSEEDNRKIAEHKACHDFEMRVQTIMSCGARDRAMALRWIHEAEGTQGDDDFLCWTLGLPYQYFRKVT